MPTTKRLVYSAAMAATIVLVAAVLSVVMSRPAAWFVGGFCGVIPTWFSLPPTRRVWWKALLAGIGAGAAAATIVYLSS